MTERWCRCFRYTETCFDVIIPFQTNVSQEEFWILFQSSFHFSTVCNIRNSETWNSKGETTATPPPLHAALLRVRGIFVPPIVSMLQLWPLTLDLLVACSAVDLGIEGSHCYYSKSHSGEKIKQTPASMFLNCVLLFNGG